jgi:diaminohydroxyphosphoribosylaminopyrimidine deaminase/5-amino-6-(5-phosphoribosylamino)uracil reductase
MDLPSAMRRALSLAFSVRGRTLPNPAVGAAIWDARGQFLSEGATQPPGGEHAEAMALRLAGARARGGTLAVTLEPCVAFPGKRTPACSEAILRAGIARVVVGCLDPNPRVRGEGLRTLRARGIEVLEEPLAGDVPDFYEGFSVFCRTGRPRVTLKIAMSRDGKAAAAQGVATAITGEAAKRFVHGLRAQSDAILIGKGTLLCDDPRLDVRLVPGNSPHRVVLWSGAIPERDFRLYRGGTTSFAGSGPRPEGLPQQVEWIPLGGKRPSLSDLVATLGQAGIHELLVEPGPRLLDSFLSERAWDRLWLLRAPKELPGGISFDPDGKLPKDWEVRMPLEEDEAFLYRA